MAKESVNLLNAVAIQHAEALGLQARHIVEGFMAGEHKSPFRGFSIEFTQHREYVAGDDIRHLDWKVLGRSDRYYLKQYEQETNYVANILLDGSESMKYGSGLRGKVAGTKGAATAGISKFDYGKTMAACLCYLIMRQRDAVAMGLFDTELRAHMPRTGNLANMHGIMRMLCDFDPTQATGIAAVLHAMAGQIKRKGLVIIISDLFDDEEKILAGIQHLRFIGQEVIVFHTMDPFELEFPFGGVVEFQGLEALSRLMTRPREIRKSYLRELEAFKTRLRQGCERHNTHYVLVNTSRPLEEVLGGYLAFRLRTTTR